MPDIPIVGQPFSLIHKSLHCVGYCNCHLEEKVLLVLVQDVPVQCPRCKMVYTIMDSTGPINLKYTKPLPIGEMS